MSTSAENNIRTPAVLAVRHDGAAASKPLRHVAESPPGPAPKGHIWLRCLVCEWWFTRSAAEHKKCIKRGRTGSYCSLVCTRVNSLRSTPDGTTVARHIENVEMRRAYAQVYHSAKKNAPRRSIQFTLTIPEFDAIVRRANGCCEVSGLPFRNTRTKQRNERHPFMPSLDRIDSTGPYSADNVRLVSIAVNNALGTWGLLALDEIVVARFEKLCAEG